MKKQTKFQKTISLTNKNKPACALFVFFFIFLMVTLSAGRALAISDSETVTLSFNIQPVTVVKATTAGARGVDIGPVVPGVDATSQPLEVEINTNTNERYRVYHEIRNRPTSGSGGQFPEDELKFMVGNGSQGGQSAVPGLTAVPTARTLVFQSGPTGGADRFSLRYSVASKKSFGAGDYYGDIYLDVEPA